MTRTFIVVSLLFVNSATLAQNVNANNYIREISSESLTAGAKSDSKISQYKIFEIDLNQISPILETAPHRDSLKTGNNVQITLPQPDGSLHQYRVMENSTMHPELAAKYPEIRTYDGYGLDKSSELVKLDITPQGFHAMILRPGKSAIFIDPLNREGTSYYRVYSKNNFTASKPMKCGVISQNQEKSDLSSFKNFADYNTCELRKYRLAMAATAQYTQYQGGTVPLALAAQVTTMNRVNGIYETDMAITMEIIPTNNLIIYTDPDNQPYTSGDPDSEITENQTNIDAVIGTANYDIGHVVDAAGSGLAALGSVCVTGDKAQGVTGTAQPDGDPFDVDYVAHEMGHQFGASHTQNNDCNRNDLTAVEPGSGSTIMGYAGICAPNVQPQSNAYFNGISLQEMGRFVTSLTHNCAVKMPVAGAPSIISTTGNFIIPANTPFTLTATAASNTNNVLTYTWEQMNNEITPQPPISYAAGGPNFRSISPGVNPTRYFPSLLSLAQNGPFTWEVLPSVSRTMKFRVSVRGNTPGGSCNAYTDVGVKFYGEAGPFIVTSPVAQDIHWIGNTSKTITWDVANTNIIPVDAKLVDILLSTDGGATYPHTILSEVPNLGLKQICVPNIQTNSARLMIKASNGSFFNVSKNNFSIAAVSSSAPYLKAAQRNPMQTTQAFIYFNDCVTPSDEVYTLNGLPGATIKLDSQNNRFIISNITTPKKISVSITVTGSDNISKTSNLIIIPGLL